MTRKNGRSVSPRLFVRQTSRLYCHLAATAKTAARRRSAKNTQRRSFCLFPFLEEDETINGDGEFSAERDLLCTVRADWLGSIIEANIARPQGRTYMWMCADEVTGGCRKLRKEKLRNVSL
jgi:hypothetical protein